MESTDSKIDKIIDQADTDSVLFTDDFRECGTPEAVRIALHRLVKRGVIHRLARGIYAKPGFSRLLDTEVLPDLEKVAKAIARRDKATIIPTGSQALHVLGLSTQIPLKLVYLTDGSPRVIKIGKGEIVFKRTSAKNLSYKSELIMLVIQALREIGQGKVTEQEEKLIIEKLKAVDYETLKHDISIAPQWVAEIMAKALKR